MDYNVNAFNRCVWFRITSNVRFCEHGNETSGVIQRREFLDQLSHCQLLKKDFFLHELCDTAGSTNFPKLQKPPQNSKRQRNDWKRIPY